MAAMASLPPRPESPPRDRDERRPESDRYAPRNTISPSRPRERVSSRDRSYVPARDFDTYRPAPFDNRRGDSFRRSSPIRRDSRFDRDRQGWGRNERDRPSRAMGGSEYDRDRRPYDLDRDYDRRRGSPRRRSRSPPRRRASPPPYYRDRRSRSPYRSSSPRKPLKLGNHSIASSPRSRSPYDRVTQRRGRQNPRSREGSPSPFCAAAAPMRSDSNTAPVSRLPEPQRAHPTTEPGATTPETKSQPPVEPISDSQSTSHPAPLKESHSQSPQVPSNATWERRDVKMEQIDEQPVPVKCESPQVIDERTAGVKREISPSPPRQPRLMNNPTMRSGQPRRWSSRSPPRGPRIHPKNTNLHPPSSHSSSTHPPHAHPPTAPHYPTGPRIGRRNHPPNTSAPPTTLSPQPAFTAASPSLANEVKLPIIPIYEPKPSLTADLDQELARLQAHRAHIASDYLQHEKGARRALHELDMATVDLRAAEGRRKIADMQLEKAKSGSLGIDAQPIETPVV